MPHVGRQGSGGSEDGASHLIVARLYEHVEPIDRGERYEDPLQDALSAAKAGTVTGGGVQASLPVP